MPSRFHSRLRRLETCVGKAGMVLYFESVGVAAAHAMEAVGVKPGTRATILTAWHDSWRRVVDPQPLLIPPEEAAVVMEDVMNRLRSVVLHWWPGGPSLNDFWASLFAELDATYREIQDRVDAQRKKERRP